MDTLKKHELFEIEVLEKMNSAKLLDSLVFGGGTMLRLCHELNRYSVDLDFWFLKEISHKIYFNNMQKAFKKDYEITDAKLKYHTILLEIRSSVYPKRLKIEIRKKVKNCDFQEKIAFSKYTTKQVMLKAHTLEQTMKNKVEALLDRKEIRDAFDMEFLLRRGVPFPEVDKKDLFDMEKILKSLKDNDFKVKLGSILESDIRRYYNQNRFSFLQEKLKEFENKKNENI